MGQASQQPPSATLEPSLTTNLQPSLTTNSQPSLTSNIIPQSLTTNIPKLFNLQQLLATNFQRPSMLQQPPTTNIHSIVTSTKNPFYKQKRVCTYLAKYSLAQYVPVLIQNGFDSLYSLLTLNDKFLDTMGITAMGHHALLITAVRAINPKKI
jgi:hypothetical protein